MVGVVDVEISAEFQAGCNDIAAAQLVSLTCSETRQSKLVHVAYSVVRDDIAPSRASHAS